MEWLFDMFGTRKPIIAMCHFRALPGDPGYDPVKGLPWVIEQARQDLQALQEGGVDAVMFSNEYSLPYLLKVEPITHVTMARIIGELLREIKVPFGVNVLWDPTASIELAVATGALFRPRDLHGRLYERFRPVEHQLRRSGAPQAPHRRRQGSAVLQYRAGGRRLSGWPRHRFDRPLDRLQHAAGCPLCLGPDRRRRNRRRRR